MPPCPRLPSLLFALATGAAFILAPSVFAADVERGKDIYEVCAACHGDLGQGGKRGEYPRLAGQRDTYLTNQLKAFRDRSRINLPMFPYTQERELSEADMEDLAAYLSGIELSSAYPVFKDTDDALTRLTAMEKVMIIPRAEGNTVAGATLYRDECQDCHDKTGRGRGRIPRLAGQYTSYLTKQMASFIRKERLHDEKTPGGVLNQLSEQNLKDIMAYITTLQ
ncbi:MAG: c-type cytochrome [Rhodocyclaceae bacterium]|nr:c-type cytochrome [Rhodocyclaceae bacterium]